jgi:Double-GTPase 2
MTPLVAVLLLVLLSVIALGAVPRAVACGRIYFTAVGQVLGVPDPATAARPRVPPDGEPAYEQYLFGPAGADLRLVLTRIRRGVRTDYGTALARTWERWWGRGFWAGAYGLLRVYGILVGTLVGATLVVVVTAVQVVAAAVLAGAGLVAILGLRGVDAALLRLRGIRMTCPHCYRRIGYPAYRCPRCGAWHRDVRPGRYGVLRRRCRCDAALLPTLLLLGSHRLTAFCPHADCGVPLADATGTASELLLPIVGGQNAGKTRLMTVIVRAMTMMDGGRAGLEFADRTTGHRISRLETGVLAGDATAPTPPGERPRAYSMYLTRPEPAAGRRLVHLFDSAGERFYESELLEQLRYLGTSRTFVFVIDPLSIDGVWDRLEARAQDRLAPLRSRRSPEFVFQQVLDSVERMSLDPKDARLAVVVTKADLIRFAGISPPAPGAVEQWLDDTGLDNLVRTVRHTFGPVRFFLTSAQLSADGEAEGVPELVDWLLAAGRPPLLTRSMAR